MNRSAGVIDHCIGAALAIAYVALLLYTAPDLGLSRDEGTYVAAAESYGAWLELLWREPGRALDRAAIDRYFRVNHEHPGLIKSLFAISHLLDRAVAEGSSGRALFTRDTLAFRFIGMLSAGLLLWLIHIFGTRLYGRAVGLFAALAYALLPRPFYHAHLDAFDIPITLAVLAVTYGYYRALRERRWVIGCGLLFGLALATKHNSWILPGIYLVHFAFVVYCERVSARRARRAPRLSRVPCFLVSMLLLGPPVFVASWPWVWHDTLTRIGRYARFHLQHDYYNIAYFGENYFWPPFPLSFPWVMTLYTVPVTVLLLSVVGLVPELRAIVGRLRALARGQSAIADDVDPRQPEVLLLGCMLAPLVLISLPSTPIFGGTKHWFTAYPFMALFAGLGFVQASTRLATIARELVPERLAARLSGPSLRHALRSALAGLFLLPGAVETAHSHPFGLSHYGLAAGFVPGAADRGMNRQFWGFTTGSLVDFLAERLPRGGRVYVCDTTHYAFRLLARDGLLPKNIVPTANITQADYAIVHHEHHFAEVDHQIWTAYGTTRPAHVLTYDGVPIISVYENPNRPTGASSRSRAP